MPFRLVTTTSTSPPAWGPVSAVIEFELTKTTFVAETPPIFRAAPAAKPEPVMVTGVPPRLVPVTGLMDVIETDGRYVNPFTLVTVAPFGFVTTTLTAPS